MKVVQISLSFLILLLLSLASPPYAFAQQIQVSFSCSPLTGTFKVGDIFTVDYTLNTRSSQVFGAEVFATYDTSILEPVGSQSTLVTNKTNWLTASANTIDTTLGKIHLDYGNSQPAFSGEGSIGQIAFRAKNEGQAQFNFTFFQPYDNTTPGIAKVWGKKEAVVLSNILTDVTNCIYVIEATSAPTPTPTLIATTPTPTPPPIGAPTVVPTVSQLPRAGYTEVPYSLLLLAVLIIGIGLVTPVKV